MKTPCFYQNTRTLMLILQLLLTGVVQATDCDSTPPSASATIQPVTNGLWYQAAVWPNGQLPTANDDVYIPPGITVHMAGTCRARTIEVAGVLTAVNWQVTGAWIDLETRAIMVLNGGLLQIGTESAPYQARCHITLMGNPSDPDISPSMGKKFIGAMPGGRIYLHGLQRKSWTQLNQTANAGDIQIVLKDPVDWAASDEIVIASTAFDMNQAEKRRVTQVNGNTVTLDAPLTHTHFGVLQQYTRPDDPSLSWTLDERAEVGLLSRNITIQGDASSDATGFGGHIMGMTGSSMRASNIELTNMGQRAELGRYPWHWHLVGDGGQNQYIRNSSIHRTYNRAITIHATNYTVVEYNVAYDNVGHAYFFEDGNETNNIMQFNLGLVTKRPDAADALLPSDIDNARNMSGPATFWISHPNNKINFNHAAGSDGSGIWFAPHQNINSDAYIPGLDPNKLALPPGNLDNNVAHSSTHGLLIGPTILPNDASQTVNPNYDYYPRSVPNRTPPLIKNYTLYKNKLGAYLRVGQNTLASYWENFIIADNYKGDALTWNGEMDQCLWVGGSQNYEAHPTGAAAAIGGAAGLVHMHTIYDGPVRVKNSYFAGLTTNAMSLFDQWGANIKYTGHSFRNTTVEPGSYRVNFRDLPDRPVWSNAVAYDIDGSLTNTPMTAIHTNIPILVDATSSLISPTTNGMHSDNRYCYVEVRPSDGWECDQETRQKTMFRRSDGAEQADDFLEVQGVSLVPVVNGKYTYTLAFENELPYRTRLDYHSMNAGEYVIIGFPGAPLGMTVSSTTQNCPYANFITNAIPEVSSLDNLKTTTGSAYAYEGSTLYTRYQAPAGSSFEDAGIIGSLVLCLYDTCAEGANLAYSDSDGDGMRDIDELDSCRDPFDAKDLELIFAETDNDFYANHIDGQALQPGFWLMRSDERNDPFIRKEFNFDGNQIKQILVKTKSQASGSYQLRWKTLNNPSYGASKLRTISYTQNQIVELTFDMTGDPLWENQTITGLRIDFPVNANANVHHWMYWIKGLDAFTGNCPVTQLNPNCIDSYIDYVNAVDSRGWVARSSPSLTISAPAATAACSGANQFTVQRVGTQTDGFADYHINPSTPGNATLNWSNYSEIHFDICGGDVPYIVYVRDAIAGYSSLGLTMSGGDNSFSLPTDVSRKDEVNDIILRIRNQDLDGNTPVTVNISEITLGIAPTNHIAGTLTEDYQYQAIDVLTSDAVLTGNVNIKMNAGSSVELLTGFSVTPGTVASLYIETCQ